MSAAAIFQFGIAVGKFHGVMQATAPLGCRTVRQNFDLSSDGTVSPKRRRPSPAMYSIKSIASWTSPFPSASRRAARRRISPRLGAGVSRQAGKARWAAVIARSTSLGAALTNEASGSRVAGLIVVNRFAPSGDSQRPLIHRPNSSILAAIVNLPAAGTRRGSKTLGGRSDGARPYRFKGPGGSGAGHGPPA